MDAKITIIGAGVIGLAIAERLSEKHRDVFLVEKNPVFGQETSSRNSEVIHAGIYYPKGSLKARLCVEGKNLLYDFCKKWDVTFSNCGKLIVATSEDELKVLAGIKATAAGNGVDLTMIDRDQISRMEPNIFALGALWSPTTGIIDSHALMKRLETNFLNNDGQVSYKSRADRISRIKGGYEIAVTDGNGNEFTFSTEKVINSAGLSSDRISELTGIQDDNLRIHFCKGEYFRIKPPKNKLISRLIYPVPHHNMEGIGIHVTIDTGGGVKLGPDVTYLYPNTYDYSVDASKQNAFWRSARKFLPFLEEDDIVPEMAGIRPKTQREGQPATDFYIKEESARGYEGFVNLIGMESPGLTSCLAIARYVESIL